MAITNGYATLAQLRSGLTIPTADTTDDTKLELIVQAVSRKIDQYCRRRFWVNSADETRYYNAVTNRVAIIDDCSTCTSVALDNTGNRASYTTLTLSTDYDLLPDNAALDSIPWNAIQLAPYSTYRFNMYPKTIKVVGKFGWSAIPDVVREACLLWSARIYARKDVRFGEAGSPSVGVIAFIPEMDADVKALLAPPMRRLQGV